MGCYSLNLSEKKLWLEFGTALSQCLQLDPDLTLEKAMRVARQQEAVQEQQEILGEAADSKKLDSTVIKHKQQLQTGQSHLS